MKEQEFDLERMLSGMMEETKGLNTDAPDINEMEKLCDTIRHIEPCVWGHFSWEPPSPGLHFIKEMVGWTPTKHQVRWYKQELEMIAKTNSPIWLAPIIGRGYAIDRRFKLMHPIEYQYPANCVNSYEELILNQQLFLAKDRIALKLFGWTVTERPNLDHQWYVVIDNERGWSVWLDNFSLEGLRHPDSGDIMTAVGDRGTRCFAFPASVEDRQPGCFVISNQIAGYLFSSIANNVVELSNTNEYSQWFKICRENVDVIQCSRILRQARSRKIPKSMEKYYGK